MIAVVQRVSRAEVRVGGVRVGGIDQGLLVLLGVAQGDTAADAEWMARKLVGLRIFSDDAGKMNLDVSQVTGRVLLVSQFTLLGDCAKGRRPGFDAAAQPEMALPLYEQVCAEVEALGIQVERGVFGEHMNVSLHNDGPVTIILNSATGRKKEPAAD